MIWGQLAALGTAISFSMGSTMFTLAGRRVGSPLVNRMRLLVALPMVMMLHLIATGELLPLDVASERWFWMGLSGVIGLALGDAALFQAFVMLGPRLAMLIFATNPVMGLIMAWIFLGETLTALQLFGIFITLMGIAWVVSEPNDTRKSLAPRMYLIGIGFALLGAFGQASGMITSKVGLGEDMLPLTGNVMRLFISTLLLWTFTAIRFQAVPSFQRIRQNRRALLLLTGGAFTGPVIGVWLSLIAVQRAPVGIVSTLTALTPVFLIPIGRIVFGESISRRAVMGTAVAFLGSALLFIQ